MVQVIPKLIIAAAQLQAMAMTPTNPDLALHSQMLAGYQQCMHQISQDYSDRPWPEIDDLIDRNCANWLELDQPQQSKNNDNN